MISIMIEIAVIKETKEETTKSEKCFVAPLRM